MTGLHESALDYAADHAAPGSVADLAVQRAYMAGALGALTMIEFGERTADLLQQCLDYGKTIGTALEGAR
jgi:hypothetical protein